MVSSTTTESPVKQTTSQRPSEEILALEARPRKKAPEKKYEPSGGFFKGSLIEENRMKIGSRTLDVIVSLALHVTVITVPIFAGLFFTDAINLKQFAATVLVAPPPPPPPPPAPVAAMVKAAPVHRVFMSGGKLIAPTYVPSKIADIKEAPLEPDVDMGGGVLGGVLGGVPGGQLGGVIRGVIGGALGSAGPPMLAPKVERPRAPVRVGGRIRAPRAISQPAPVYPMLARQAHIAGDVLIDAVLDEQGNVVEIKVVSGPPVLYQAAIDALKRWKYEPTYLNDQPVPVQLIVRITFTLD